MKSYFKDMANKVFEFLGVGEFCILNFTGESTDFVRFNHAQIRQPGSVLQNEMSLRLIIGQKHAEESFPLTGDIDADTKKILQTLNTLRETVPKIPDDPHLYYNTNTHSSDYIHDKSLVSSEVMVLDILELSHTLDLVGVLSSGIMYRGFANSLGQMNWFQSQSFNFDFSLYHEADKAVKNSYAGVQWNRTHLLEKINQSKEHLNLLRLRSRRIDPGEYRCYLAPAAVDELIQLLNWEGLSYDATQSKTSPLMPLFDNKHSLSQKVSLSNCPLELGTPTFDSWGFCYDAGVDIVENGHLNSLLISARSAKEYQASANSPFDYGEALSIKPGGLSCDDRLKTLDTGIVISNLWYCNYSDRPRGRITGMTRFASFWVENGEIKAPINAMRFDDSVLALLGDRLIDLDQSCDTLANPSSYENRSVSVSRLPGILVSALRLTL